MAILHCGCTGNRGVDRGAKYQDEKYGLGNRVCNEKKGDGGKVEHRCTVCGDVARKS